MDERRREQIAMFRFGVIGPLISGELEHGELNRRMHELSLRRYTIPYTPRSHIAASTIEEWLYAYRKQSFDGLKPQSRKDTGATRAISKEVADAIVGLRREHPRMSVKAIINQLVAQGLVLPRQLSKTTVYRLLATRLPTGTRPTTGKQQRRFSHRYPNDCWQGDVMHGPYIKDPSSPKTRKTYLVAFIDDATRLIVGAQFFFSEVAANIKTVLRHAVLTYGVPSKLYLDNGQNFRADDIQIACASMRTALIFCTPYYPEGKGKIERFIGTVRSSFLPCITLSDITSLVQLNHLLEDWLQNQYNRSPHSALNATPLQTFLNSAEGHIRRLPPHIDPAELFCKKETRQVAKDATFRIDNVLYETQEHLIGKKIGVLYDRDDPTRKVKVFDGPDLVHTASPIDYLANAHSKRNDSTR